MKTWQKLRAQPDMFSRYFVKERILRSIRQFFWERDYHELESPILTDALPQERYLNFLSLSLAERETYLIPSTERFNKIMLAAGLGQHFVVTKVFRGMEQIGPNHSPEFTMLEWYHLDADYFDLMDDCEQLFARILQDLGKTDLKSDFHGTVIDFGTPWHRKSIRELLREHAEIDLHQILELPQIKAICLERKLVESQNVGNYQWQDYFELLMFHFVEPNLDSHRPTFVYDYPKILGPLTQPSQRDPQVVEKVELYIAGKEIANGYTELLDAALQKENFERERQARAELGLPLARFDHQLIEAIAAGLPPVAGIGLGVDRLAMILADADTIADVNYFPATEWEIDD